jgi:hypothetical protein
MTVAGGAEFHPLTRFGAIGGDRETLVPRRNQLDRPTRPLGGAGYPLRARIGAFGELFIGPHARDREQFNGIVMLGRRRIALVDFHLGGLEGAFGITFFRVRPFLGLVGQNAYAG